MKRGSAIKMIGALCGGAVLLPAGMYLFSPGTKEYARQVILKELNYLDLEPEGISGFLNDYFKTPDKDFVESLKWKAYYFTRLGAERSDNLFELVRSYLLSTDFFINGHDVNRQIKYVGLFNQYTSSMPNPYSYIYLK